MSALTPDELESNCEELHITVSESDRVDFKRLDQYLVEKLKDFSRTFIKGIFEEGLITAVSAKGEAEKIELKKMPPVGTMLEIEIPPLPPSEAVAENIPLDILYEDDDILFVNKPAGMVTHPAPGHYTGTLVNALLFHFNQVREMQIESGSQRPGIVHRLDMGTSGVMVVAKNSKAHEKLVLMFSKHDIERLYEALVMKSDNMLQAGMLEGAIGRHPKNRLKMSVNPRGRWAKTYYKMIKDFGKCCLMELKLETGRTHQIRVHLSTLLKAAILNDKLYGNPNEHQGRLGSEIKELIKDYPYPFLHARVLGLNHPITGKFLRFEVPAPELFEKVKLALNNQHEKK